MIEGMLEFACPGACIVAHAVHDAIEEATKEYRQRHRMFVVCLLAYMAIQEHFTVHEDWAVPGPSIVGRIEVAPSDVIKMLKREVKYYRPERAWEILVKIGALVVKEERIELPLLGDKLYALDEYKKQLDWGLKLIQTGKYSRVVNGEMTKEEALSEIREHYSKLSRFRESVESLSSLQSALIKTAARTDKARKRFSDG